MNSDGANTPPLPPEEIVNEVATIEVNWKYDLNQLADRFEELSVEADDHKLILEITEQSIKFCFRKFSGIKLHFFYIDRLGSVAVLYFLKNKPLSL